MPCQYRTRRRGMIRLPRERNLRRRRLRIAVASYIVMEVAQSNCSLEPICQKFSTQLTEYGVGFGCVAHVGRHGVDSRKYLDHVVLRIAIENACRPSPCAAGG